MDTITAIVLALIPIIATAVGFIWNYVMKLHKSIEEMKDRLNEYENRNTLSNIPYWIKDSEGSIIYVSSSFVNQIARAMDLKRSDFIGKKTINVIPKLSTPLAIADRSAALNGVAIIKNIELFPGGFFTIIKDSLVENDEPVLKAYFVSDKYEVDIIDETTKFIQHEHEKPTKH